MSKSCSIDFRLDRGHLVVTGVGSDSGEQLVQRRGADSVERINDLSGQFLQLVVMRSFAEEGDESFMSRLRLLGREIFSFFFDGFEDMVDGCESLRLCHEAYYLPLEFSFDGTSFLGLKYSIGNWLDSFGPIAGVSPGREEKNYVDMLFLGGDDRSVWRSLSSSVPSWRCHAVLPLEPGELFRRLETQRYDIVHLTGHGNFDENEPEKGFLFVSGRELLGQGAARLSWDNLRAMRLSQPLVFLNACHSGRVSSSYRGFVGFADALLHAGASSCVTTVWSISDYTATFFAQEFYDVLSRGGSLGNAIRDARRACWVSDPDGSLTGLSYVLFGDPDVRIRGSEAEDDED